jgi:hypothetical protein
MNKNIIVYIVILLGLNFKIYSQEIDTIKSDRSLPKDTVVAETKVVTITVKDLLCKKWLLKESLKNNRNDDFDKIIIEFLSNGKYNYTEDEDSDNGVWEMSGEKGIVFDKGTKDEELWEIKKIEPEILIVIYKDEGNYYEYQFIPLR